MGDPLSIAASVAGLITISAHIVGMAKDLFSKVKDAPETMKRVREEVESMQPIFCQVQLLLYGTGSKPNHGNLTMISIHNLMATLTGCVIVHSKLEKMVNEVCGFDDPTTASAAWKRVGVIANRVKWGLWRHEEVLCIIEDLQRQKLSLNLMLTIITCTTTTEASVVQGKLQELCKKILQSNHAHSVLLRDLISRQEEQARALNEIRLNKSTPGSTGSSAMSTRLSSANSRPCNNSDNASFSLRFGPSYMEDLKASRAYKRPRQFGLRMDSSSGSVFSSDSSCSAGNWSIQSDMTLGDLSVSEIAILNLPIDLTDVSNPKPFQEASSTETHSRPTPRRKRSSRGRIHNAIENGNGFVIRVLLAMGMDIEELDSNCQTPLIHATLKCQEAICKLLLEKGADIEALKAFTNGMDFKNRSDLFDLAFKKALDNGPASVTVLRLLVLMALGTTDGGDDTRPSHQINVAIAMNYWFAVCAIIHLEPRVLAEVDAEGRTPFARIIEPLFGSDPEFEYYESLERIFKVYLLDTTIVATLRTLTGTRITVSMHDIVKKGYNSILHCLSLIESRDTEGWTPLASAAFNNNEALCVFLVEKGCSLYFDTEQKKQLKPKLSGCIHVAAQSGHKTALQLLLDMGADINERDSVGKTALLETVRYNHLSCVKTLIERGADATLSSNNGRNVLHHAAWNSTNVEIMKFLLEHVVEIRVRELVNMKDGCGNTPLHDCGRNRHISLENAKMLVQASATLTIENNYGKTPYELAQYRGNMELAKYLWSQLSPEQQARKTSTSRLVREELHSIDVYETPPF